MSRPGRMDFKRLLRRVALGLGVLAVAGYVLGVAGGFLWLRYSRKIEAVSILDVAFFRVTAVRHALAAQQFAQAEQHWKAKEYQEAYVLFISAVRRDPANTKGRMAAARFLGEMGATNLRINLLEEGVALAPADPELNEMLFTQLIALGRNRRVLELLQGAPANAPAGPNTSFRRTAELQATLAVSGAPAAKALLLKYPELRTYDRAAPVISLVLWQAGDRPEALQLLAAQVAAHPELLAAHITLASCQAEAGQLKEAIDTALRACDRFPGEPAPRVLLFDLGAARLRGTTEWWKQIGLYLRDFHAGREAVFMLAEQAGKRGWLEVTRTLYELGAERGHDLGMLALFQSDALMHESRFTEARQLLQQIDDQSLERNNLFLGQLRQREIAVAATLGDREGVREYARRFAGLLRGDTDQLEHFRQLYQTAGLPEAVAEFSERKPRTLPPKQSGT